MTSEQELLDLLGKAVAKHMGGLGGTIASKIGDVDSRKMERTRSEADRKYDASVKRAENVNRGIEYATKLFPEKLSKALSESGDGFAKTISKNIKSIDDVFKVEDQIKSLSNVYKKIASVQNAKITSDKDLNKTLNEINEYAKVAGVSLKDLGVRVSKQVDDAGKEFSKITVDEKNFNDLGKSVKNATRIFNEVEDDLERHVRKVEHLRSDLLGKWNKIKDITKEAIILGEAELRYAAKFATADAGLYDGMTKLGISQIEYMHILKNTRIEQMAASTAGVDFTQRLITASDEFEPFTESLLEAGKAAQRTVSNLSNIGVSTNLLDGEIKNQAEIYKKYYRTMGMGEEEFSNFTKELISNSGTQNELYLMREKERAAFVKSLQVRTAENIAMGYSVERTKKLNEMFSGLLGMNPKDRMKKAAKERAMLGALGMGGEGARLFDLQVRYRTMGAKERIAAQKEMTEIRAKAASQFSNVSSGPGVNLGQSMQYEFLAQKTGTAEIMSAFETETGKGRKYDIERNQTLHEISKILKAGLKIKDVKNAVSGSSLGAFGIGAAGYVGTKIAGSILSKAVGGGGGLLSKMTGVFSKGGDVASTVSKTGSMDGLFDSSISKGGKAGKMGKLGKMGKMGKAGAKFMGKKIPIIGAGLALGYAADRLIENGDVVGASMEAASGLASIVPGIGTALSIAIDAASAARDMAIENEKNKNENTTASEESDNTDKENETKQDPLTKELLMTMKEIRDLLSFLKETGDEKAQALTNVANATIDTMRFNMVNASVGNRSVTP